MLRVETDLRDIKTGESIECIYSGEDTDKAWAIADEYNQKNIKGWDKNDNCCVDDFIGSGNGLIADVYYIENEKALHGVGKHFIDAQTREYQRKHLVMLARIEEQRRNDGTYANASTEFRKNSADKIKNYLNTRTSEEREMEEYQIFIDSMRKSLAVLS